MVFSRNWVIAVLGLGVLVAACDRDEQRALGTERDRGSRTPTINPDRPMDQAPKTTGTFHVRPAERIAQAQCDYEQRCGNVGADKKYATSDACFSTIRRDRAEELNVYECPGGFDEKELN